MSSRRVPLNCLAPSLERGIEDTRFSGTSTALGSRSFVGASAGCWLADHPDNAARRISRILANLGRSANRSSRTFDNGGRKPDYNAHRERIERCEGHAHDALEIRSRAVIRGPDLCYRHRLDGRSSTGPGTAADTDRATASTRKNARHLVAAFVHKPRDEDRRMV